MPGRSIGWLVAVSGWKEATAPADQSGSGRRVPAAVGGKLVIRHLLKYSLASIVRMEDTSGHA